MASLLPALSLAIDSGSGTTSDLSRYVETALGWFGLAPDLGLLLSLVVAGITVKCLLTMAAMRYVGFAVAEVATGLRSELIKSLLNARWGYFTDQPLGRIANAVSVDATRAGRAYLMAAVFQVNVIQTVIYATVAALVSWRLALAALALGGFIALALNFLIRASKKAGRRQTKRTTELVVYLSDALSNIKPLKAMAKAGHFSNLFDRKIDQLRRALESQVLTEYALKNLEEILVAAAIGLGFYLATIHGDVPVSELLVMGLLLFRTVTSIGVMQRQLQKALFVESGYWAMRDLISETESAREPEAGSALPTLEKGCKLENVIFAYGPEDVLRDVSMDIPARGLTVITGASGSGKTTLTDLLLGFYQPRSGRIMLDGVPLSDIDLRVWRGMIGYVPQDLILFHDTVLANVTLGDPRLGEADARRALEAAGAWDFVSALPEGLNSIVGEKGAKLSGGQRQRIALARALVSHPKLLILDEVTSALDPRTERDICRNIDTLSDDMTILAITHREAWTEIADRTYHLDHGRAELVKDGRSLKRLA